MRGTGKASNMKNTINESSTIEATGNPAGYAANWPESAQADRSISKFIDQMDRGASVNLSRRQLSEHIEANLAVRHGANPALPRVLHVDADADSALLLATLLVPETEVVHVSTREAALRLIGQQHFNLIVLDPELADGDGSAVFEALKKVPLPTKVLLFSAHDTVWRDQASAFLIKPWTTPLQLWNAVSRLLGIAPAAWTKPVARGAAI
jgi:two-component system phosphate regulon response regulator OmpR